MGRRETGKKERESEVRGLSTVRLWLSCRTADSYLARSRESGPRAISKGSSLL